MRTSIEEIRRAIERVEHEIDELSAQRTEITLLIAAGRRELDRLNRQYKSATSVPVARKIDIPGRGVAS